MRSISAWYPQNSSHLNSINLMTVDHQPDVLQNILGLQFNCSCQLWSSRAQDSARAPCIPDVAGSSAGGKNLDIHSFTRNSWGFIILFHQCLISTSHDMAGVSAFTQVSSDLQNNFRAIVWMCVPNPLTHRIPPGTIRAQNGKFAGVFLDKVINLLLEHTCRAYVMGILNPLWQWGEWPFLNVKLLTMAHVTRSGGSPNL